jgi:tetratricopeptide (TPR) repeat protein
MRSTPKRTTTGIADLSQRPMFFLCLIFILTIASYSNTLHSPTVLDDSSAILESSRMYLRDLSFQSIAGLAETRFGLARFIPVLSFALNNYFSGDRIIDYHLTNIAIHLITFLCFYLFLKKIIFFHQRNNQDKSLEHLPASLFIALTVGLWTLNPVQTNAITYLVQRMTALCALFYVASLYFYLQGRQENRPLKSLGYFLLAGTSALGAFLSKENSATLPIAALMVEGFFISPGFLTNQLKKIKPIHWVILTLLVVLAAPFAQGLLQTQLNGYSGRVFTFWERLLTEARVVVWYISLLIVPLPSRMNLDHDFALSHSLIEPWTTSFSILLILLLFGSAIKYKNKNPLYSFGILWFFLNLMIESTIIPLEIIFEHRLYLPSMGLFIAISSIIAILANSIYTQFKINQHKEFIVIFTILTLSILSILTSIRNNAWYNAFTIYEDCYNKSPNKPRVISNMGLAYAKAGDNKKARALFYETISKGHMFSEEYISSSNNIIISLINDNKPEEAMIEGERLYKNIPPNANLISLSTFLYTLGLTYQQNHKPELALESFKEALRSRSDQNKDLFIYDAIFAISREISQKKSQQNLTNTRSTEDDSLYAFENLFQVAIQCRDYNLATTSLNMIKELSINKFQELSTVLDDIISKNKKSASISDINQHKLFITDAKYRKNIKIMAFINKHYSPLKFIARNIMATMTREYADDPFVLEMNINNTDDHLSSAEKIAEIDKLTEKYSDYPQILSLAANLYLAIGAKDKALPTITKLLDIYPAHPNWLYWEQMKTKLRPQNKGKEINHGGPQIGNNPSSGV